MRKRLKPWQQKYKFPEGWMLNAIASPVLLAMMWGLGSLSDRNLQPAPRYLSQSGSTTRSESPHESPSRDLQTIVVVGGVIFLSLRLRRSQDNLKTSNFSGADLNGVNFFDADLRGADFNGANLCGANFSGANLSDANFSGANLSGANLSGANFSGASLRFTNLSGANLRYADFRYADLRYADLGYADLNCTFLSGANLSDANLSGALLFLINLRDVLNLEPLQLKAEPSPFLCNVALPYYAQQPALNPNGACHLIPKLLSDRYSISLKEAEEILFEARQHRWD